MNHIITEYQADDEYDIGIVIEIGGDQEVTQSSIHLSRKVLGVVTKTEHNKVAVLSHGRGQILCLGPIRKGEMITSSDVPGHAVAIRGFFSEKDSIAIIGKSLEDSDDVGPKLISSFITV